MSLFNAIRSKLGGQRQEAFGLGQRFPLTKGMISAVRGHITGPLSADLSRYTFERRDSSYPDSKSDLIFYDRQDKPVLHAREFQNGLMSVWQT